MVHAPSVPGIVPRGRTRAHKDPQKQNKRRDPERGTVAAMKNYTRNTINNNYNNVIAIPYCDAHFLLKPYNRTGCNYGVYGWNYDVFDVDGGVAIVTGYRNMHGTRPDRETLKTYETRARAIWENYSLDYETQAAEIKKLLAAFVAATV